MINRKKLILPYLLPAVLFYAVFFLYPAIRGFMISFYRWDGFAADMEFIGLRNYKKLFTDGVFMSSLTNTLLILFVGGFLVFLVAFIFTAMMSQGIKAQTTVRAVIFFPQIVAPVALAIVWKYIFRYDGGLFNSILEFFNLGPVNWTGPDQIIWSAIGVIAWGGVGFYTVILLAGVDKIPTTLFESAKVEGASTFKIFFKITLPLIWDVMSIAIILWSINAIRLFDFLYAFGGPTTPPNTIWNLALYQFVLGFTQEIPINELGYSSAIAVSMILLTGLLVLLGRRLLRRGVYEL